MKRIVLLLVLCGFILAGCGEDIVTPSENERDVWVYFSASPLTKSFKSAASTDETEISKLILYGVDDKDVLVTTFPVISNPSLTGITLTIPVEVTTFYAIANPSAAIESTPPSTFADLLNLTGNFTAAPAAPFIMGGKGVIVDASASANIELIRAVAKIEVIAENEFEIESVTVMNTPDKGYVFRKETRVAPTTSGRVNYDVNTGLTVYVAENSKDNPTELLVKGTYLGKQANYKLVLKKDESPIDIARNTFYKVRVSAITHIDCTFTITIPDWDEMITEDHIIPDDDFES